MKVLILLLETYYLHRLRIRATVVLPGPSVPLVH